jgi:nitric oxide reductase subunit B
MTPKKLWRWLAVVMIASFAVLIFYGTEIYRKIPPIPNQIVSTDGTVLATGQDIKDGQNVWQSIGGQTVGSIWGHGAYIAPDWTADYLHGNLFFCLTNWPKRW